MACSFSKISSKCLRFVSPHRSPFLLSPLYPRFFFHDLSSARSYTAPAATTVSITHTDAAGKTTVLKKDLKLKEGEIVDASFMSVQHLRAYFEQQFTQVCVFYINIYAVSLSLESAYPCMPVDLCYHDSIFKLLEFISCVRTRHFWGAQLAAVESHGCCMTFSIVPRICTFQSPPLSRSQAKKDNQLMSLHLKATMMKISDPVCCSFRICSPTQPIRSQTLNSNNHLLAYLFSFVHVFCFGNFMFSTSSCVFIPRRLSRRRSCLATPSPSSSRTCLPSTRRCSNS